VAPPRLIIEFGELPWRDLAPQPVLLDGVGNFSATALGNSGRARARDRVIGTLDCWSS